jgi:antitoxin FitA
LILRLQKAGAGRRMLLPLPTNHFETIMVSLGEPLMPVSLTLKNIPDEVYERLKVVAGEHRRSLNSQAICCLEASLVPVRMGAEEHLQRARELRRAFSGRKPGASEIDAMKRAGRA